MSEISTTNQSDNNVTNGDIVGGNKVIISSVKKTKLSALFERLKVSFDGNNQSNDLSDNLKRFSEPRDLIGLEQKLIDGKRQDLLEDAAWLKQEYFKKLTKFQFFEPAQEIHAFLLSIVLEKFRNIIYPMFREGSSDLEISRAISCEIINPILSTIQEEGCDDIMGLSATDVEGMVYFLTGQCHIKWIKNDRIPSSV